MPVQHLFDVAGSSVSCRALVTARYERMKFGKIEVHFLPADHQLTVSEKAESGKVTVSFPIGAQTWAAINEHADMPDEQRDTALHDRVDSRLNLMYPPSALDIFNFNPGRFIAGIRTMAMMDHTISIPAKVGATAVLIDDIVDLKAALFLYLMYIGVPETSRSDIQDYILKTLRRYF